MTDFNINASPGDDAAQTNSIVSQIHGGGGAEGAGEYDLTTAVAPKKSLPLQAISVGLVLVVGAGSLYLMRRHGTRAGIDFSSANIVVSAVDTTRPTIENEAEILAALESSPPDQVPTDQVPKRVFDLGKFVHPPTPGVRGPNLPSGEERRRVEIQEALGKLQVESVMLGRVPIAKISGKLFRVGDKVDLFRLDRIEDRTVYLTVDGREFELSMVN